MKNLQQIAFIGGGNMASAIIGGLLRQGQEPASMLVLDPHEAQRDRLAAQGLRVLAATDAQLQTADLVVWAVKPQQFKEAALACAEHTSKALHYSVMAGLRSTDMARLLGTPRIVRAMPNTPALVGQGMTGLFARPEVHAQERTQIESLVQPTGQWLWVNDETQLDAITALSGSGPAYVFYFIEAMMQAGADMGLDAQQGRALALATFAGATTLAAQSADSPATLRDKVTSKGGTTYAALSALDTADVKSNIIKAIRAAQQRAGELGDEFGR